MDSVILQLLKMYSLTYSEVIKSGHTQETVRYYLDSGCGLIKVELTENNKFKVRKDIDIIVNYNSLKYVDINGLTYWENDYNIKWFILHEDTYTQVFGTKGLMPK